MMAGGMAWLTIVSSLTVVAQTAVLAWVRLDINFIIDWFAKNISLVASGKDDKLIISLQWCTGRRRIEIIAIAPNRQHHLLFRRRQSSHCLASPTGRRVIRQLL
jgi:hypothetical protein